MAWTCRVFCPEQRTKKSVKAGVWRRSRTTTSIACLASAAFTVLPMSAGSAAWAPSRGFFFEAGRGFFSALAMQVICRSGIEMVLTDMRVDQRRHEPGERRAAPQPIAHQRRGDVG